MEDNNRAYKGKDITVYWTPKECVHAATCFSELISVFNPAKRPWVNMDGGTTEEIIDIVNRCPTNALMFKWNDATKNQTETSKKRVEGIDPWGQVQQKEEPAAAKMVIMADGPAFISGNFVAIGPDGGELKTMEMSSFCRCGNSKNMPFCDGMHRKIGFEG